jgi:hypothetical protein
MFALWLYAATLDENGITNKLIPYASKMGRPAKLRRGIRMEPAPTPNIPLVKPDISPIRK